MCKVLAIGSAPLSTVTPFNYAQIAFAALISWLLFRNWRTVHEALPAITWARASC